jgi:hypothetical protein
VEQSVVGRVAISKVITSDIASFNRMAIINRFMDIDFVDVMEEGNHNFRLDSRVMNFDK